jgi:transcriptional regulator with XRE-family HTH domain
VRSTLYDRRKMARRFKRFRKQNDLTQEKMAQLMDLDRSELIHIEKARRYPHYTTIGRLERLEERANYGKELARAAGRSRPARKVALLHRRKSAPDSFVGPDSSDAR